MATMLCAKVDSVSEVGENTVLTLKTEEGRIALLTLHDSPEISQSSVDRIKDGWKLCLDVEDRLNDLNALVIVSAWNKKWASQTLRFSMNQEGFIELVEALTDPSK